MYRYTVMAVSIAVVFAVIYILLDLVFGRPVDWVSVLFESVVFGIVMTVIQYYKERNNNKV
jgi:hypothetical protein